MPRIGLLLAGIALPVLTACGMSEEVVSVRQENGHTVAITADGQRFTDAPQPAWLGPHKFMIPANYSRDQIGVYGREDGFYLVMHWQDLSAVPPGRLATYTVEQWANIITARSSHLARISVQEFTNRLVNPSWMKNNPILRQDPIGNIDYRTRGEDRHGLEYWYVSEADAQRYRALIRGQEDRYSWPVDPERYIDDWYIRRDAEGNVQTFIRCNRPSVPDGWVLEGRHIRGVPGATRSAGCEHSMPLPEYRASASLSYRRLLLHEWQRFEQQYRDFLHKHYAGLEPQAQGEQP